jgi:hypothetical protein
VLDPLITRASKVFAGTYQYIYAYKTIRSALISQIEQSNLFFIIGPGRSGTSLLQEIMNTFEGFCNTLESIVGGSRMSCYAFIKKNNDFSELERFIHTNWNSKYFVEKTPNSILCLPQLSYKYPAGNYLFLERHPIKILLSQMNYFPPGEKDKRKRLYDIKIGNVEGDDLFLNYEQHRANQVLKMVKAQVAGKPLFTNQLTIRYENLVNDIESCLFQLKDRFNIVPNISKARGILARPSSSSRRTKYDIKSFSDAKAVKMMKEACLLWHYDFNSAA